MTEETIPLLQELIRQRCVNTGDPASGNEMRSVEVLKRFFADTGLEYEVVEPAPGRGSIVLRVPGTDPSAPSVTLLGHLDVVPVPDEAEWQHDPFGGELIDGVVWGRGTIDMLGLTSVFATVARRIALSGNPLKGDIVFAGVADEEAGGRFGTGWIALNRPELVATDYALTENGGIVLGDDAAGVTLTVAEKGGAPRQLTVRGRSGHGSVPWRSANAAARAAEIVTRIAASPGEAKILPHWRAFVEKSGFPAELAERLTNPETVADALDELGPLAGYGHAMTHMTVSPNVLHAGVKSNVIPSEASIGLDIRLLPGQGAEDVERYLDEVLGELSEHVEIGDTTTRGASTSEAATPFSEAIERAVREHYPNADIVPVVMPGGTDGRYLREKGTVTYGFGLFSKEWDMATFRSVFHGKDERIDVESLRLTAETLETALRDLLG